MSKSSTRLEKEINQSSKDKTREEEEHQEKLVDNSDDRDYSFNVEQEETQYAEIELHLDRITNIARGLVNSATSKIRKATSVAFKSLNPKRPTNLEVNTVLEEEKEEETPLDTPEAVISTGPVIEFIASNFMLSLPSKNETFAYGYKFELSRPVKTFLTFPLVLKLIPKMLAFLLCSVPPRTYHLKIVLIWALPYFLIFWPLFKFLKSDMKKLSVVGFGCYLIDLILTMLIYIFAIVELKYIALPILLGNLAGDIALLHNVVTKKTLSSTKVFVTTFVVFLAFYLFFCPLFRIFRYMPLIPYISIATFVGVIASSLAAKEVFVFKERLEDVDSPISLGDCFYHAITARKSVFFRQVFLAYSKLFVE